MGFFLVAEVDRVRRSEKERRPLKAVKRISCCVVHTRAFSWGVHLRYLKDLKARMMKLNHIGGELGNYIQLFHPHLSQPGLELFVSLPKLFRV